MFELLAQVDPIEFNPTSNTIWGIVIGLIGFLGSGIGAWLTYKSSIRQKELDASAAEMEQKAARLEKTKEVELEKARLQYEARESDLRRQAEFFEKILSDYESLRKRYFDLESTVRKLQDELEKVERQLEFYHSNSAIVESYRLLQHVMNNLPMPAWIHEVANNNWYLNDPYCEKFNVNRKNFWDGVNVLSRYDQDDALEYQKNNILVIQEDRSQEIVEKARVYIMDPRCENFIYGVFVKTPIEINEQTFILGYMKEELTEEEYLKRTNSER